MMSYIDLVDHELRLQSISNKIGVYTVALEDAMELSGSIESLSGLLSNQTSELSPLTARSINVAIESIYSALGASSPTYVTISTENLVESDSVAYAMESLNKLFTELWGRVRDTMDKLWSELDGYWADNFSAFSRIRVALLHELEVVNNNYNETAGKLSNLQDVSMSNLFSGDTEIDDKLIEQFMTTHEHNFAQLDYVVKHVGLFNQHAKTMSDSDLSRNINDFLGSITAPLTKAPYRFGTSNSPMTGGDYISVHYEYSDEDGRLNVVSEKDKTSPEEDVKIRTTNKYKLIAILKKAVSVMDKTITYSQAQKAMQREFKTMSHKLAEIHLSSDPTVVSNYKKAIGVIYKANSAIPGMFGVVILSNVKLSRGVIKYSQLCLKS